MPGIEIRVVRVILLFYIYIFCLTGAAFIEV